MTTFEVSEGQVRLVVHNHGSGAVIQICGELDAHSAPKLEDVGAALVAEGAFEISLDMSETSFLDSSALRAILTVRDVLQRSEGELFISRPSDAVRRLFTITGLDQELTIREAEQATDGATSPISRSTT